MKLRLSVKRNLMVELEFDGDLKFSGGEVLSYSTNVASIKKGKIQAKGKYSRTTSKHLYLLSHLLGFPIEIQSNKNQMGYYDWYEYGVNISHPESLSSGTSIQILNIIKKGKENFFQIALDVTPSTRRDANSINEIIEDNDLTKLMNSMKKIKETFALV